MADNSKAPWARTKLHTSSESPDVWLFGLRSSRTWLYVYNVSVLLKMGILLHKMAIDCKIMFMSVLPWFSDISAGFRFEKITLNPLSRLKRVSVLFKSTFEVKKPLYRQFSSIKQQENNSSKIENHGYFFERDRSHIYS